MRNRLGLYAVILAIIASSSVAASATPRVARRRPAAEPQAAPVTESRALTNSPTIGSFVPGSPITAAARFVPRQFTVLGAGDILLHQGLWSQGRRDAAAHHRNGFDFDPIFTSAIPRITAADLAICHMETPLAPAGGPYHGFPIFEVPPAIANTIHDIGYDTCSTGSNHSLDGGQAGIDRTLNALDAAGVQHTGTARSANEAATPDLLHVNGVTVAQLSYAYGFNGLIRPADKPWLANLINVKDILAAAHRAKLAGAEVVIVSLHFGTEYQHAPNAQQLAVAKALLASPDVDLILGCHAHVVQPFQEINGKWVAYGMGNQIATQGFSKSTEDGVMPEFTFTEITPGHFKVTKAEAIPTYDYLGSPIRLIDIPAELAKPGLSPGRRALYLASWKRTKHTVDAMGAAKHGLVVVGAGSESD